MVRDRLFRLICIPLLGLLLPLVSDFAVLYQLYYNVLFLSLLFFMLTSFLVWQGSIFIIYRLRYSREVQGVFPRVLVSGLSTAIFSMLLSGSGLLFWKSFIGVEADPADIIKSSGVCAVLMVIFSLVYEILFLNKEREIDSQIVGHLDKELLQAEINVLRNELDPHFVYNSLMPLYYLVKNDIQKAEAFARKLIQVYQYFLENRQNDFITLEEELKFIENYFFLLQIRYKDSLYLSIQISNGAEKTQVVPLSLQILIENVIKHNDFDKDDPLQILIGTERNCLVVSNSLRCKACELGSSKIGLKNLRTRYKILAGKDISVIKNKELFIVKIPLLRNTQAYDVSSYNRG